MYIADERKRIKVISMKNHQMWSVMQVILGMSVSSPDSGLLSTGAKRHYPTIRIFSALPCGELSSQLYH